MIEHMQRISLSDVSVFKTLPALEIEEPIQAPHAGAGVVGCAICKGSGYYTLDRRVKDPDFGALIPCSCMRERKAHQVAAQLRAISGVADFTTKTFASFRIEDAPGTRRAFIDSQRYAHEPNGMFVLLGGYGCGKTHLAAAIANAAFERAREVIFAVVPDLLDHLRSAFAPGSEASYDERFEHVRRAPLLILDDLGTESATPWAKEKLYQLINHRYNAHLPTVVTSNQPKRAIDGRIVSRLSEGKVIAITSPDYRTRTVTTLWPE